MNVPKPTRSFPRVDDAGYPRSALDDLVRRSEREFVNALAEHPEGDNWSDIDPEELISRAIEHLENAKGSIHYGEVTACQTQAGHALNFMLFAMDAIPVADGTNPPMRDPVTDGGTLVESAGGIGPRKAVLEALRDGPRDGLDRTALIERAASLSQTTRERAETAVEELRKRGEIYTVDGTLKLTKPEPAEAD